MSEIIDMNATSSRYPTENYAKIANSLLIDGKGKPRSNPAGSQNVEMIACNIQHNPAMRAGAVELMMAFMNTALDNTQPQTKANALMGISAVALAVEKSGTPEQIAANAQALQEIFSMFAENKQLFPQNSVQAHFAAGIKENLTGRGLMPTEQSGTPIRQPAFQGQLTVSMI